MDVNSSLFHFTANVGGRRCTNKWYITNAQTKVRMLYSKPQYTAVVINFVLKFHRLMHWIQSKVPDLPLGNFTNDWTSGKAVGALVDSCAPGLCPDWDVWDPKDAVQNASEAMGLADDWLNVRQLIRPEEMVNPNIDEQSMMTYLSQYPNAKLKTGAPLRPKTNPNR